MSYHHSPARQTTHRLPQDSRQFAVPVKQNKKWKTQDLMDRF